MKGMTCWKNVPLSDGVHVSGKWVAFIYINYGSNRKLQQERKEHRERREKEGKCNVIRFQVVCSRHKKSLKACRGKMSERVKNKGSFRNGNCLGMGERKI